MRTSKGSPQSGKAASSDGRILELQERIDTAQKTLHAEYYEKLVPSGPDSLPDIGSGYWAALRYDILEHAWQEFGQALRTTISGGTDWPNLQIVTLPTEVRWDDPVFGPYYFHKEIADLVNGLGGAYCKTAVSFSERYGYFLNDVQRKPLDEEAWSNARDALGQAEQAQASHFSLVQSIKFEWIAFDDRQKSSLPPWAWLSMEEWYEQSGRNRVLKASKDVVLCRWQQYLYYIQKAFGGAETLVRILMKLRDAKTIEVIEPRIGSAGPASKMDVLPYRISPDFPSWLADAQAGHHQVVTLHIKHDSGTYNYSSTSIGAGLGLGLGFFGVLAVGGRKTVQIDTTQIGFELDFKADVGVFHITPGDWYDTSAFTLFRNGPFYPGSPIDNLFKQGTLFDPKGFLSFRSARAIVAYKPEIRIRMRYEDYHYFRQVTEGYAVFFVGPFAIGAGSYYDVKESVRWDNQNLTLELFNAPPTPHLLAFDSEVI